MSTLHDLLVGEPDGDAVVWRGRAHSYRWLADRIVAWNDRLDDDGVEAGTVVGLRGDFSPDGVASFLALAERACIVVPLPAERRATDDEALLLAGVERCYRPLDGPDVGAPAGARTPASDHDLYLELRRRGHPGLVLFTSGSAGTPKAALHDLDRLIEPLRRRDRRPYRALAFLLFDHIGGLNTMLRVLSSGGCLVVPADRTPDRVLQAVTENRVELLPTSPSFLNLVLASGAHARHDLSSLRLVTYGTEPMPESTLARLRHVLPDVELRQTYGLSELGILSARSRTSDSVWVQVGGPGFETRVVDGMLEVRARSAMLGYLNAPSPFTDDGWFATGDLVETDGEYLRILGRASETVNVGGLKVHPSVVENVLLEVDGVAEATAYGMENALLGRVVCARIRPLPGVERDELVRRAKGHCRARLQAHERPMRLEVSDEAQHGTRFKKERAIDGVASP